MEIRQMRYFLAVAERMHFTQAAKALHVSQPALSQQIQLLEEEIGAKLLERTNRRVELTMAGIAFRERARAALREASEAISDARLASLGQGGNISIGFVTTASVVLLPAVLDRFCTRYPDVAIKLHELSPEAQLEALEENRIAVGFSSVASAMPYLECKLMSTERFIVALHHKHPAASRRTVDLADLADERLLLPPRGVIAGLHEEIVHACHCAGFVPRYIQPIRQAETAVYLVSGKLGVALIPESFRRLKVSGVVYKSITGPPPLLHTYAIRRHGPQTPLLDNFWSCVESMAPKAE